MNLIQNDEESNSDLAKWPWSGKYHAGCPTVVTYIGLSPYLMYEFWDLRHCTENKTVKKLDLFYDFTI